MSDESTPDNATNQEQPTRRDWLMFWTIATGAIATLVLAVPMLVYLLGALFKPRKYREDRQVSLGKASEFPPGETRFVTFTNPHPIPWDGDTGLVGVYVQRAEAAGEEPSEPKLDELTVFAINCTHLGCPVTWFQDAGLFLCPCHGGAYYANGDKASGPPPRGLYKYKHWIESGKLMINAGHLPTLSNPAQPAAKESS